MSFGVGPRRGGKKERDERHRECSMTETRSLWIRKCDIDVEARRKETRDIEIIGY